MPAAATATPDPAAEMKPETDIRFRRCGRLWRLDASQWLPVPPPTLWRFLSDCRHMNLVIPPFVRFEILTRDPLPPLDVGAIYDYRLHLHGIPVRWRTRITIAQRPESFTDVQERGPYAEFTHHHTFQAIDGGTAVHDRIDYRPPGGPLAGWVNRWFVQPDLRKLFEQRHRRLAELYQPGQADPVALLEKSDQPTRAVR